MKRIIPVFILLLYICGPLHAQVDTINPTNNRLLMGRLQEGTNTYVVYTEDSLTKHIKYSDIWIRSVSFGERNNVPVVNFAWKWYRHDTLLRDVHDACLRSNLKPLDARILYKGMVMAFNFTDSFLVASDTVALNKADPKKKVALNPPPYNWEWDMETFGLLPIKKVGQKFMIAFLDPFDVKSDYYLHQVTGTEYLALNKDVKIKCWILRCTYNATAYADFWISRQSHEMLKMKEYYNGTYRYKVKLY